MIDEADSGSLYTRGSGERGGKVGLVFVGSCGNDHVIMHSFQVQCRLLDAHFI